MPGKITLSDTPIIPADPIMQTGRSHAPSEVSASPNGTLYDKLGGPDALEAAVDLFYEKVLADERLKHFFEGTNMMRLVIKQVCSQQSIHSTIPSFMHACMHAFTCWLVCSFIPPLQMVYSAQVHTVVVSLLLHQLSLRCFHFDLLQCHKGFAAHVGFCSTCRVLQHM